MTRLRASSAGWILLGVVGALVAGARVAVRAAVGPAAPFVPDRPPYLVGSDLSAVADAIIAVDEPTG